MNENYRVLKDVLDAAFKQASEGKGAERHGQNGSLDFMEQPMMAISALLDTDGGLAYQAIKKITEARGLPTFERQERELLGAINYIAGMIMHLRRIDSIARADADFDNAAQQFESFTGCKIAPQAANEAKRALYCFVPKDAFSPELLAKFRESVEQQLTRYQNPLNLYSTRPAIDEDLIIMVNKMQNTMVKAPEPDYQDDIAAIVNPGDYWEAGNRHRDLYARRLADVVKSQAMLNPGKAVLVKLVATHEGYTLDLTDQRAHVLDLLCRGGMYQVESNGVLKNEFRVTYNH